VALLGQQICHLAVARLNNNNSTIGKDGNIRAYHPSIIAPPAPPPSLSVCGMSGGGGGCPQGISISSGINSPLSQRERNGSFIIFVN
jgi:hypothetical protein